MGELYEVLQVAERLKVSEDTVRMWIRRGELAYIQAGRRQLVTEEDLQEFLAARRVPAKSQPA